MAGLRKVEYITSSRGTSQVLLDGYVYNKNASRATCQHWACTAKTCRGKCTTVGDYIRNVTDHNHPPTNTDEAMRFISNMRKRAREETTPLQALYNEEITQHAIAETHIFPSFPSLKSALYRHRKTTVPPLPNSLAEVNLEEPWTSTSDGQPFLLFQDHDADKMLVFATVEQLQVLQASDTVYMDGTFSACPNLWNQLYILHARRGSTTFPLVYALLPDRRTTTYARLFRCLKHEVEEKTHRSLLPATVQIDFEQAAIRAVHEEFPDANVKGCFFHFTQAIWRKVQDLGLAGLYKEDEHIQQWVRRAAGLPLLPVDEVQDAWLEAMDQSPDIPQSEAFHDYVVTTWVDYDARFPIAMWNHNQTNGPRTNNNVEGFHNRLNRSLPHHHPNIYRFIEVIRKIEFSERAKLAQQRLGAAPPPRKRVYREIENRVSRLIDQVNRQEKTSLEFLDAVGHLLKLA